MEHVQRVVMTPLGAYRLSASARGICALDGDEGNSPGANSTPPPDSARSARTAQPAPPTDPAALASDPRALAHLAAGERWLQAYFAGERPDPGALSLDLHGTPFQLRVWEALQAIPYGQTCTYAQLAVRIGVGRGGSRAVGGANGRNPVAIIVPCHRVVAAGGGLGGYAGGLHRKRFLLHLEGARLQVV
ncbi:MAG TPA: methylated-DNA--[protein]-cysteine S-methyltransferase [Limnochordia bacterium]|nr:methylated-DNA--[protein]-cysteine S-methyltransferase [Limnochordia bacterium]